MTPFENMTFPTEQKSERAKNEIDQIIREAQDALRKDQEKQAQYFSQRRRFVEIQVGKQILVQSQVLRSEHKRK